MIYGIIVAVAVGLTVFGVEKAVKSVEHGVQHVAHKLHHKKAKQTDAHQ